MKVAIMQPYLFPYIGYFQLLNCVDTIVIYDDVNYIKKGWINRNKILVNGISNLFTISLKDSSQNKHINQIEISDGSNWRENLIKKIEYAYKKAPLFDDIFPLISEIIKNEESNLSSYLIFSLKKISNYLRIDTNFVTSSELVKDNSLKGQDKIVEICRIMNASEYINAIGGLDLYENNIFLKNNVTLKFIKAKPVIYSQFKNEFVPWLSIIDVLMFNSIKEIKMMLKEYELI